MTNLSTLPITVTVQQLIELAGGLILLLAAYYALMAQRTEYAEYQRLYRRAVAQTTAVFLVLAYTSFVLWPESDAWPTRTGYHLYYFFTQLETVPAKADAQLTDYYLTLFRQIGAATGTASGTPTGPVSGLLLWIEGSIRTIGLVIYTVVFTLVSLGAQLPTRISQGIHNAVHGGQDN